MSRESGATQFSVREIHYLESLPAVEHVSKERIRYTPEFRRECMRAYAQGESPVRIFRSAGLDPSLIGYKRIERCIARWKRDLPNDAARHSHTESTDPDGAPAALGAEACPQSVSAPLQSPSPRSAAASLSASSASVSAVASPLAKTRRLRLAGPGPLAGPLLPDEDERAARPPVLSVASPDRGSSSDRDIYGLIIMQQARKIDQLERQVEELREELRQEPPARRAA